MQHRVSVDGPAVRPHWSVALRALREARGVTLDGWAARFEVSRRTVQRWERGERGPDARVEAALIAYCHYTALFRTYTSGPLAGVTLTSELLQELCVASRWSTSAVPSVLPVHPPPAAPPPPAPAPAGRQTSAGLPAPLTSFIGRERELAAARQAQAEARLFTLTGPGGSGKTRLALALASERRDAYTDGVYWVDLASLATSDGLGVAIADRFSLRATGGQSAEDTLVGALRDRQVLLVLDNCEHLLPDCALFVTTLLESCPGMAIIATSRESLGVAGETEWLAPPLSLPANTAALDASDAARLLLERAQRRQPTHDLTAAEQQAVVTICHRLDGLPLALELAAARAKVLSFVQIAERLDDRFQLLTSSVRGALPRQQTLRATMDWSYELLTGEEQAALRALSVFAGGFSVEAAEEVAVTVMHSRAADEPFLDVLQRLVEKSMVHVDIRGDSARYGMLETVREYATEQRERAGESPVLTDAHARWSLKLAERAWTYRNGAEQRAWLDRLTVEHDNLRAALAYYLHGSREAEAAVRLAGALWWFWEVRGHGSEARRLLTSALALPGYAPPLAKARALEGAGVHARDWGDLNEAQRLHEQAMDLRREAGDTAGVVSSLNNLGTLANMMGDFDRARSLYEECLAAGRKNNDAIGIIASLSNLGMVARSQGELARARALYEECLTAVRQTGDVRRSAIVLVNLGNAVREMGELRQATAYYRDSLSFYSALGELQGIARCLHGLANIALSGGDIARAIRLAAAAAHQRAVSGFHMPADSQANFDQLVRAARAAVGDEAFASEWRAGQARTVEEAVFEAMDQTGARDSDVGPESAR